VQAGQLIEVFPQRRAKITLHHSVRSATQQKRPVPCGTAGLATVPPPASGGVYVRFEIVLEDALEHGRVLDVAGFAGMRDVVLDHPLDAFLAGRRVDEIVAELDGDHLGKMLVLGDGEDFLFGQFGQFDAVLNGQHGTPLVEIFRFNGTI
jgi:hypothetical protein